jgi:hypothetical protein
MSDKIDKRYFMRIKPNMKLINEVLDSDQRLRTEYEAAFKDLMDGATKEELAWRIIEMDIVLIAAEAEIDNTRRQAQASLAMSIMGLAPGEMVDVTRAANEKRKKRPGGTLRRSPEFKDKNLTHNPFKEALKKK